MSGTTRPARCPWLLLGCAVGALLSFSSPSRVSAEGEVLAAAHRRPTIVVYKARRQLLYFENDILKRRFPMVLGKKPKGTKERQGDNRTPEGEYYVTNKATQSRFLRFLGLSYPNLDDARRGLVSRIIDRGQYERIKEAINGGAKPPWGTGLGGYIGIHGEGEYRGFTGRHRINWTEGCISVSDENIRILYDSVDVGTPVLIFP